MLNLRERRAPAAPKRAVTAASAVLAAALMFVLPSAPAAAAVFSNPSPITMPPHVMNELFNKADPYPSSIAVRGFTGTVTDVNVTLCGFSASFPSDANVMLMAPDGSHALVMSDVGGNGEDVLSDPQRDVPVANITLTLDDAAPNPLPADSALSPGTFRPLDDDTGEVQLNDEPDSDLFLPPAPSTSDNVALSTFNGVDPNGTWNLYVMDDYPAEPSDGEVQRPEFFCGWSIEITTTGGEPVTGPVPPADFDGDGDTDVSVFRPASGYWFVNGGATVAFGTAGDIPVPADYDGNGTTDIAVYRPTSGYWFVNGGPTVAWGTAEDIPAPGDYDGDGDTDIAVYRPSSGYWFVNGGPTVAWGAAGDIPVPGDYDGDGDTDIAVYRPSSGYWFVNGGPTVAWGAAGDIPVPGDYDGDGDTDIAVHRPSSGYWFVNGGATVAFGTAGDIPVPGDYDGDGDTDIAVYRPSSGYWFVNGGTIAAFGAGDDVPLPLPDATRRFFFPPL